MPLKLKETNISNEHNRFKNPNWQEADQLAIYKRDRGVELGSTEKQLQRSGQSGTWTHAAGFQVWWPNHSATLPPYISSYYIMFSWCLMLQFFSSLIKFYQGFQIFLRELVRVLFNFTIPKSLSSSRILHKNLILKGLGHAILDYFV